MVALGATLLALVVLSAAHPAPDPGPESALVHEARRTVPGKWYHERDHPVYELFRRDASTPPPARRDDSASTTATLTATSSSALPSVGSASWSAAYPQGSPDVAKLPSPWVAALASAISAGLVPDIPTSTLPPGGVPVYPGVFNKNRNNATICAATDRQCRIPSDIYDAPDGVMGIGFDDGPTDASPALYDFLQQQNQPSTHFMIGRNILTYPSAFTQAYAVLGADIAVHTWTHPYLTTLSSLQVLAELAWTMQIIHDSTDGRLPRYWRPPSGDTDARVGAIAQHVLGLTAILWNEDTRDWSIGSPGGATLAGVQADMTKWLGGPKTPGLIILEHELTNATVDAFIAAWPLVAQNGWKPVSQAQMNASAGAYQDGKEADAPFNSLIPSQGTTSAASASDTSASTTLSADGSAQQASHSGAGAPAARPMLAILLAGALVFL